MKAGLLLALVLGLAMGAVQAGETKKPASKDAGGMTTVEFPVRGMMCQQCVRSVSSDFKAPGVADTKADMGKEVCIVTFDKSKTDLDKILAHFNSKKGERFTAAKPGEKVAGEDYVYDGKPETLSGDLSIKGKDAGANVVCRIIARRSSEKSNRVFNVIASGENAKKIEELRNKGLKAKLTGVMSEKGLEVSSVE